MPDEIGTFRDWWAVNHPHSWWENVLGEPVPHNVRILVAALVHDAYDAGREHAAQIAEAMRPSGGRMWSDEQSACFEALSECAKTIRGKEKPSSSPVERKE